MVAYAAKGNANKKVKINHTEINIASRSFFKFKYQNEANFTW